MRQQTHAVPAVRIDLSNAEQVKKTRTILADYGLNTICDSGSCPNIHECYGSLTATFMVMGDVCTRGCRFCGVKKGLPRKLNDSEPEMVAGAVRELNLAHVVITSVTRDDLDDCGVSHFVETIKKVRELNPGTVIEVLIPDFGGDEGLIETLMQARPDVIGHNLETTAKLHHLIRPEASYSRSLKVLAQVKKSNPEICVKSGIMLGLGENENDVIEVMMDLKEVKCDIITLGQYLRPTGKQVEVKRYVAQEEYESYRITAERMGIPLIAAGTYVRSSYKANEYYKQFIKKRKC